MDTKTGYIYGAIEEIATRKGITMAWGSNGVIESGRRKAEREALDKMLASFPALWSSIHARYRSVSRRDSPPRRARS